MNSGASAPKGDVLSFEAKESTKESRRHGDSGKKAPIAHFDGGARNVARNGVGWLVHTGGARSCSPFSAVKMGGPFSLRCLSPLCSPAVGVRQTQMAILGMLWCGWGGFAAQKNRLVFSSVTDAGQTQPALLGMLQCILDIFVTQNASVVLNPRWHLLRAGGPVARRRSLLYKQHGAIPNRRAARPVAERR